MLLLEEGWLLLASEEESFVLLILLTIVFASFFVSVVVGDGFKPEGPSNFCILRCGQGLGRGPECFAPNRLVRNSLYPPLDLLLLSLIGHPHPSPAMTHRFTLAMRKPLTIKPFRPRRI